MSTLSREKGVVDSGVAVVELASLRVCVGARGVCVWGALSVPLMRYFPEWLMLPARPTSGSLQRGSGRSCNGRSPFFVNLVHCIKMNLDRTSDS